MRRHSREDQNPVLLALLGEAEDDKIIKMGQQAPSLLPGNMLSGFTIYESEPAVSSWLSLGNIRPRNIFCFANIVFKNTHFQIRKWWFQIKLKKTSQGWALWHPWTHHLLVQQSAGAKQWKSFQMEILPSG